MLKENLLKFAISDNFSNKFFDNHRIRQGIEKEVNLCIKDVTAGNGYKYMLPLDILERPDRDYIVTYYIDKWNEKHNKDIYGNKVHIFTSSKVSKEVLDQYIEYKKADFENISVKMFKKDGTLDDAAEEFKHIVNSFIAQSSSEEPLESIDFEDGVIDQLKQINSQLSQLYKLLEEQSV